MESIFTKLRKQLPESAGCALLMSVAFLAICVCAACLYLSCKNFAFGNLFEIKMKLLHNSRATVWFKMEKMSVCVRESVIDVV